MSDIAENKPLHDLEAGAAAEQTAVGGDPAGDDLSVALSEARAEAASRQEDYLRLAAEMENLRKRSAREVTNARQFGIERFAGEMLSVLDSLEMGLAAAGASAEALREGSEATLRQLLAALDKNAVVAIDPAGEPFDPQLHEAMTTQPSDTLEPGSVITVVQKGYTLNGRLLRPARVVVAAEMSPNDAGNA